MVLILNVVLCLLVIAMVVTPLARAIAASRPEPAEGTRRRQRTHATSPAASASGRSFAPGV